MGRLYPGLTREAWARRWRRVRRGLLHLALPPLLLLLPHPKRQGRIYKLKERLRSASWDHDSTDAHPGSSKERYKELGAVEEACHEAEEAHGPHGHGAASPTGEVTSLQRMLPLSLVCLALLRFATDPDLRSIDAREDLMVGTFVLPEEFGMLVGVFWSLVLGTLVVLACCAQSPGEARKPRPLSDILVPETGALLVFFVADLLLEALTVADGDMNFHLSLGEVWDARGELLALLRRRWFMANFSLLLAITTIEGLHSPPGTLASMAFDGGWLLIIVQALSLFLHQSISRRQILRRCESTSAALLYGMSLYYFTHSIALMLAVVFRRHVGHEHPPPLHRVWHYLMKNHPLRNAALVGASAAALLGAALLPAMADWSAAALGRSEADTAHCFGCEGTPDHVPAPWLLAVSLGHKSGPRSVMVVSVVNAVALIAALKCNMRGDSGRCTRRQRGARQHAGHASWEADLIMATGCLASLCWWALLCPDNNFQVRAWRHACCLLGASTHFVLAQFSADAFAGRQSPRWHECVAALVWALFQVFQGLATEHHANVCEDHTLTFRGILVHVGEFAMCEFGLIATLGWMTYLMMHVHTFAEEFRRWIPELKLEPLLGEDDVMRWTT